MQQNIRRLQTEIRNFLNSIKNKFEPLNGILISFPDTNSFYKINIIIEPEEGYFHDARVVFLVEIGNDWPHTAPTVTAQTMILHPNVQHDTGKVCMNLLSSEYTNHVTLVAIAIGLKELLLKPNFDDAINVPAIASLKNNSYEKDAQALLDGGYYNGFKFDQCRKPSLVFPKTVHSLIQELKKPHPSLESLQMRSVFYQILTLIDPGVFKCVSKDCCALVKMLLVDKESSRFASHTRVSSVFLSTDSDDLFLWALTTPNQPPILSFIQQQLLTGQQRKAAVYKSRPEQQKLLDILQQYESDPKSDKNTSEIYCRQKAFTKLNATLQLLSTNQEHVPPTTMKSSAQGNYLPWQPIFSNWPFLFKRLYNATVYCEVDEITKINLYLASSKIPYRLPHILLGPYKKEMPWRMVIKKGNRILIVPTESETGHNYPLQMPAKRIDHNTFKGIDVKKSSLPLFTGNNLPSNTKIFRLPTYDEVLIYFVAKYRGYLQS